MMLVVVVVTSSYIYNIISVIILPSRQYIRYSLLFFSYFTVK